MGAEEIPKASWPAFFQELSERRRNVPVALRTFEPTLRGQATTREGAFEGAGVRGGMVSLLLADGSGQWISRGFEAARIWRELATEDAEEIEIDAADGSRTMLHFPPARSPRP